MALKECSVMDRMKMHVTLDVCADVSVETLVLVTFPFLTHWGYLSHFPIVNKPPTMLI